MSPPTPARSPANEREQASHSTLPNWEDIYRQASPQQRQQLLELAARQGWLNAQEIPAEVATSSSNRPLLTDLLAKPTALQPFSLLPITFLDQALDARQREAVLRALSTPDLFLLQGVAGSGKSRVVIEIILQAIARGERVLFLAPHPVSLDCLLEQIGQRENLCPVRCLGREEMLEAVPSCIRSLVFGERLQALGEKALGQARQEATTSAQLLQHLRTGQTCWTQLLQLALAHEQVQGKRAEIHLRRSRLPTDIQESLQTALNAPLESVDPGSDRFHDRILLARRERETELARLAQEQTQLETQEQQAQREWHTLNQEISQLRPLVEARDRARWWTVAWWRALFQKERLTQYPTHWAQVQALEEQTRQRREQLQALEKTRMTCVAVYADRQQHCLEAETERRRLELDRAEAEMMLEADLLTRQWVEACTRLGEEAPRETPFQRPQVEAAQLAWEQRLREVEQAHDLTTRWANCLDQLAGTFPERLVRSANLVAATTTALPKDPHFGDDKLAFDLLILDEAERVPENELLALARRARRWILVGEPTVLPPGEANRPARSARPARVGALRPATFQRLWQQLHFTPELLSFAWFRRENRLHARLVPVPPPERRWVETEPVADHPEIELHILAGPRNAPRLVEVSFPGETSIVQAKQFIFRELEEVPVACRGMSAIWHDEGQLGRLQLGTVAPWPAGDPILAIELEPGLHEHIRSVVEEGPREWFETLGFTFSREHGWTQGRMEEWARRYLGFCDNHRTTLLSCLQRPQGQLVTFLKNVLGYLPGWGELEDRMSASTAGPHPWAGFTQAVEFLAVPAGADRRKARPSDPNLKGRPRGAGFELDLADVCHPEQIPNNLRTQLPTHGLVNYFEAQTLVQVLESLVSDQVFRDEAAEWERQHLPMQQASIRCAEHRTEQGVCRHNPAIALTALYPVQIQLLRLLLCQSSSLNQLGLQRLGDGWFRLASGKTRFDIWVESAEVLRQRECLTLMLSLTRSHSHRAVPYGDDPEWLPLILTRPQGRLFVLGDPATLSRRCHWPHALEPLDEQTSHRERILLAGLLRLVEGRGEEMDSPPLSGLLEGNP